MALTARQHTLADLAVGTGISFRCRWSAAELDAFAALSGDYSPIHMSNEVAGAQGFTGRVVHGMLMASWCSTVVGMFLPGRNGVLTSCAVDFLEPASLQSEMLVSAKIGYLSRAARLLKITTIISDRGLVVAKATVTAKVHDY